MKKIKCILLAMLIATFSISMSYADVIPDKELGEINAEPRIGGRVLLDVPLYYQENGSYCGPAALKMTLESLGVVKSQSSLANESGTVVRGSAEHQAGTAPGTIVYNMWTTLNNNLPGSPYAYVLDSQHSILDGAITSLNANYPVICHTDPYVLPNYSGTNRGTGHYVVVTGYILQTNGTEEGVAVSFYYNDSNTAINNATGQMRGGKDLTTTWQTMQLAINENAGYYIYHS